MEREVLDFDVQFVGAGPAGLAGAIHLANLIARHDADVAAGVEYVLGDLSGELTFEYDRLDLPRSEEDDYGVYLRLRRELPDVLRRQ